MSIYTAFNGLCEKFILNDVNSQVIRLVCYDNALVKMGMESLEKIYKTPPTT